MDFFNDLSKKFSQAVRTVQEKTSDGIETTRILAEIRQKQNELNAKYAEFGRACYESVSRGSFYAPRDMMDEISALIAKIDELNAQKEKLKSDAPTEDAPAQENVEPKSQYCPECGKKRDGESRYCEFCGYCFVTESVARRAASEMRSSDEVKEEPDIEDLN